VRARTLLLGPILLLLLLGSGGCGLLLEGGAYAIYLYLSEEDEETGDEAGLPRAYAGVIVTTAPRRGAVEIRYTLADDEGDPADIMAEVSTDGGSTWLQAADGGTPGEGTSDLSTSAGGDAHAFLWDAQADLPAAFHWNTDVLFRIAPRQRDSGEAGRAWISSSFPVNVNTAPLTTGITPQGEFPASVSVQYILLDAEGDAADVSVEYGMSDAGPWSAASRFGSAGDSVTDLAASPTGTVHVYVWDCGTDLSGQANVDGVHLRITASDATEPSFTGTPWVSDAVDNVNHNTAPSVTGTDLSSVYAPATTVAVHYTLFDGESDAADVTVEYQKDGSGPWLAAQEASSGSEGTSHLSASPAPGDDHVFNWDFTNETASDQTVNVRISVSDAVFGNGIFPSPPAPWVSNAFKINAVSGTGSSTVSVVDFSKAQCDTVAVAFSLKNASPVSINVEIKYSVDGGTNWLPPSGSLTEASWEGASEGLTSLSADADGEDHVFVWDSFTDLGGQDVRKPPSGSGVMIKVTSLESGLWDATPPFSLMNTWVATIRRSGGGVLNNPCASVLDVAGNVYVCDTYNSRIQVLNAQATDQVFCGVTVAPRSLGAIGGTGVSGYNGDNIPSREATLNFPRGIALDGASPPNVYVADSLNHRIRRIDGSTGFITTVAGTGVGGTNGDGKLGPQAELNRPEDLAFDPSGNLWIADTGNNQIRMLNLGSAPATVFGVTVQPGTLLKISGKDDGKAGYKGDGGDFKGGVEFDTPAGIAVDGNGSVFLADAGNQRIRAANASGSTITLAGVSIDPEKIQTVAGNGHAGFSGDNAAPPTTARLKYPRKLALDASGNIFFADTGNSRIRALNIDATPLTVGLVTVNGNRLNTVAGGGSDASDGIAATSARLQNPEGIALDGLSPQNLYITDTGSHRVRIVNADPVTTLTGVATDQGTTLDVNAGHIDTVAGVLPPGVQLTDPRGTAVHGNALYVADPGQHRILKIDLTNRNLSAVAGTGQPGNAGDDGPALSARLDAPEAVGVDSTGTLLIVADTGNDLIRVVNLSPSSINAFGQSIGAGDIKTVSSNPKSTRGLFVDVQGWGGSVDDVYLCDPGNHKVMRLARSDGNEQYIAGSGATNYDDHDEGALPLDFNIDTPYGIAVSPSGLIHVSDAGHHRVYAFTPGVSMSTVTGTGTAGFNGDNLVATGADLDRPAGLCLDGSGDLLIFDGGNHAVRRLSGGLLSIVCGTVNAGFNGDRKPGVNTQLNAPTHGFCDASGNLYFSDTGNKRVRRFQP